MTSVVSDLLSCVNISKTLFRSGRICANENVSINFEKLITLVSLQLCIPAFADFVTSNAAS